MKEQKDDLIGKLEALKWDWVCNPNASNRYYFQLATYWPGTENPRFIIDEDGLYFYEGGDIFPIVSASLNRWAIVQWEIEIEKWSRKRIADLLEATEPES